MRAAWNAFMMLGVLPHLMNNYVNRKGSRIYNAQVFTFSILSI